MKVTITGLTKEYVVGSQTLRVLDRIDGTIHDGDYLCIFGPSGAGKSTIMHIIGLMDRPTSGTLLFDELDIGRAADVDRARCRSAKIGFVFQTFNLLPRLSVLDNVRLPTLYDRSRRDDGGLRARKLLERFGLGDRLVHRPNQLSGGERQRVAIARALVNEPEIILADEPTGNLDAKSAGEVLGALEEVNRAGKTLVIITHNLHVANRARRIMRLNAGRLQGD